MRFRTGEPILNFIDTANNALPENLKDLGLKIHGSNLCNEIHLPTGEDRTAVCCLSSLNLEYYDEWKDTNIVRDLVRMLDNVLQYFIDNAPDTITRAKYSAERERSIGLGAMGFHSLLQKHNVGWESQTARDINKVVFEHIKREAEAETRTLADERGEYPDGIGTGKRNAHLLAIAPNASSGVILSTSPSIEPYRANVYRQDTLSGAFVYKNRFLQKVLEKKCKENKLDIDEVWSSIIANDGSVQHLEFLSELEKEVFKTYSEIDQMDSIYQAANRQNHIDQGQSVNIIVHPDMPVKEINKIHSQIPNPSP